MSPHMHSHVIRVLLADDHAVVRTGFRRILDAHTDFEVVGEAADGHEALEASEDARPGIVLMDVSMPRLNGIEATRRLKAASSSTRVLALSMYCDHAYVREMLRAGASGYLLKDCTEPELITALRAIATGQGYLSPAVSDAVLQDYRKQVSHPIDILSSREREILQLLAEGGTNKEIAAQLNISVHTVDAHRGRIMEKVGVRNIGELVRFAMRNGVIE